MLPVVFGPSRVCKVPEHVLLTAGSASYAPRGSLHPLHVPRSTSGASPPGKKFKVDDDPLPDILYEQEIPSDIRSLSRWASLEERVKLCVQKLDPKDVGELSLLGPKDTRRSAGL